MTARTGRGSEQRGSAWRGAMWTAIALLLLLPLIAMQFTSEVSWTASDFIAAAVLLVGAGLAYEIVARYVLDHRRRASIAATIIAAVAVIWAHGAVGIF